MCEVTANMETMRKKMVCSQKCIDRPDHGISTAKTMTADGRTRREAGWDGGARVWQKVTVVGKEDQAVGYAHAAHPARIVVHAPHLIALAHA